MLQQQRCGALLDKRYYGGNLLGPGGRAVSTHTLQHADGDFATRCQRWPLGPIQVRNAVDHYGRFVRVTARSACWRCAKVAQAAAKSGAMKFALRLGGHDCGRMTEVILLHSHRCFRDAGTIIALSLQAQMHFIAWMTKQRKFALALQRKWVSEKWLIFLEFPFSPFSTGLQPNCFFWQISEIVRWRFRILQIRSCGSLMVLGKLANFSHRRMPVMKMRRCTDGRSLIGAHCQDVFLTTPVESGFTAVRRHISMLTSGRACGDMVRWCQWISWLAHGQDDLEPLGGQQFWGICAKTRLGGFPQVKRQVTEYRVFQCSGSEVWRSSTALGTTTVSLEPARAKSLFWTGMFV